MSRRFLASILAVLCLVVALRLPSAPAMADESAASPAAVSNQQGKGGKDPFDVPDGGIEELHKYIDGLNKIQPSSSLRPAVAELRKRRAAAQCRACEKILAASPNPQQAQVAVHAKITALLQLGKLGDKTAQPALEAMANQVEKLGLKTMLREVRLAAMQNLGEQADAMEDEQYGKFVDRLKEFLGDGPVDVASANLAMNVAMAAERSHRPVLAVGAYQTLGNALAASKDAAVLDIAAPMLGAARRLDLVGKPFVLRGATLDGKPVNRKKYRGKVVLIDFFATWCGPCRAEAPGILKCYQAYRQRGFEVVAVSLDRDRKQVEDFAAKEKYPWTVLLDRYEARGTEKSMATYYGILTLPQMILVGKDGKVLALDVRGAQLEKKLEELLGRSALIRQSQAGREQTVMIPMRDGKRLATDIYLPEGDRPFPTIFLRTPYGRVEAGLNLGRGYTAAGVAVVVQDMRGRFDSEGENLPFIGCGWAEHCDGADSVAWICKQPWSDGKVGTLGGSACGITQCLMAGAAPRGLTAQYIVVAAAGMYDYAAYVGGALRKSQVEEWTRGNRFDAKALDIMRAHPNYDDYWRQFDTRTRFDRMTAPAVHVSGWFDTFAQGAIDSFVGRQHHGAPGARGRQKLVMGPWRHAIGQQPVGELTFRDAQPPPEYDAAPWFRHYLLGVDNGVEKLPAVSYYVMGDTHDPRAPGNQWRHAADWPPPSRPTPYYFASGGLLSPDKPTDENGAVAYTFDPADPCPTIGGNNLTIPAGPRNQNPIESRKDVVLFTSQPLARPLEVTGHVTSDVFLDSSAVDTDLSVRLCDVYPDGKSFNMAEGMLRLRFRSGYEAPRLLAPGEVTEAKVDCWSTSVVFNRGHRIRVTVTSSNSPRFDVNPGTGKPWREGDLQVRQTNHIHVDASHPSRVVLPVVEVKAG